MACRTPSVNRVAKNMNETLKGKLAALEKTLKDKDDTLKTEFFKKIDEALADAKITDARQIGYNSAIKTEMTSEFNLDEIGKVINSALDTAIAVLGQPESKDAVAAGVTSPLLTPKALESYKGLVTSVIAAARSSSQGAGSISFSMNRLSVGVYGFLYASSVNLTDKETFGDESITVTTIYYRIMQSIEDVQMQGAFEAVFIDKAAYLKMKKAQAALVNKLTEDPPMPVAVWMKLDADFSDAVAQVKARLDANQFKENAGMAAGVRAAKPYFLEEDHAPLKNTIEKLKSRGPVYQAVIDTTMARLNP